MKLLCLIPVFAATLGLLDLIGTMLGSTSAPQQAAGAATSIAIAVIPYVFVRGFVMIREIEQRDEILRLLQQFNDPAKTKTAPSL
jgi:hypothetical protein